MNGQLRSRRPWFVPEVVQTSAMDCGPAVLKCLLAGYGIPAHYGVRTKRYKLIYYYGRALGSAGAIDKDTAPEWELFDLIKDPHEMRNLYDDPKHQGVVKKLKAELDRLQREYKDTAA